MNSKHAREDPVYRLLDLEATVSDNDEEDEDEDEEGNDGVSDTVTDWCPSLSLHFLVSFIDDEPDINLDYTPSRQMDKTSDREGGWHDLVASLEERHASGSKSKLPRVGEDNCRNERPLDPVIVSSIENIITHNYPFWRVRCKVTDQCFPCRI